MKGLEYIELLKELIKHESYSCGEEKTAEVITVFYKGKGIETHREKNNVLAFNKYFNKDLPTILLNSHHDTVRPNAGWTYNPFEPIIKHGKLYGLGSNDAGGPLVSLIAAFSHFYDKPGLKYNLAFAATAEEEISGKDGIELIVDTIPNLSFAIVGEPTDMNISIAERGLLVIDCIAKGISGHAAHNSGDNAIYKAMEDLEWIRNGEWRMENPEKIGTGGELNKLSQTLGEVQMNVTMINAGIQHNVIPDNCKFTIDIRTTDAYSNEEVVKVLKQNLKSEIAYRSLRLRASSIDKNHPVVKAGVKTGRQIFTSNTISDVALLNVPAIKMGPGSSLRSHIANEFIMVDEIEEGIEVYIKLLNNIIID